MQENALKILREYFGYTEFREGQAEIISALVSGRDVSVVMPTGGGKSLCFQIPALMSPGVALVISPLISLMKDQVAALNQNGIAAAYINSSLTEAQSRSALSNAANGTYKLIYVAPERLDAPSFAEFAKSVNISLLAVDEAHCISQWGQDFRPSYLNIREFVNSLPRRPVLAAFTATATRRVKEDIERILELRNPLRMTTGFNRANLYFEVRQPKDKNRALLEFLRLRPGKSGIVYCSTRKTVHEVADFLNDNDFAAAAYHAGLSATERTENQDDFLYDRKTVMVATNAFGMGIDKSNVGFVLHYNMPRDVESYYQEAGRAGRDGSPADCVIFYAGQDVITAQWLIEHGENNVEEERREVKEQAYERLKFMTFYCKTSDCLRRYILKYFGETAPVECDNCGNCNANTFEIDITSDAQKILSCVKRMGEKFGISTVADVLRGSKSEKVIRLGFDKLTTYGIMRETPAHKLRNIIDAIILQGYAELTAGEYPVLKLTLRSGDVLFRGETVSMRSRKEEPKREAEKASKPILTDVSAELLAKLKALRLKIARGEDVPAFVVFSDATLVDMCRKLPRSESEFLTVSGVGKVKLERYGAAFLGVIGER